MKPMDMRRSPHRSKGMIIWSMMVGRPDTPIIRGMLNPYTSASTTPTVLPRRARATARLTVTVDLPTPPFPLAMLRTRVGVDPHLPVANGDVLDHVEFHDALVELRILHVAQDVQDLLFGHGKVACSHRSPPGRQRRGSQ